MATVAVENLRKEYGALVAVDELSFSLEQGQVLGLIGPNGAGKTTLLRMLATLLAPTAGRIEIFGLDTARDFLAVRGGIGYMPDFFNLYSDLTLEECMTFFAEAYGVARDQIARRVDEVLAYVDLAGKRGEFVRHLSRGMVQRLGVGALLVHDPDLFLLDEPASGLDPKARIGLREILTRLSRDGKTVIISSHILTELAGFCSHIGIMDRGKLLRFGNVEEIERSVSNVRRVTVRLLDRRDDAVACLRANPAVDVRDIHGDTIVFETGLELEALAEINATLVGQGIKVIGFSEERAKLEDLFMKISAAPQGAAT